RIGGRMRRLSETEFGSFKRHGSLLWTKVIGHAAQHRASVNVMRKSLVRAAGVRANRNLQGLAARTPLSGRPLAARNSAFALCARLDSPPSARRAARLTARIVGKSKPRAMRTPGRWHSIMRSRLAISCRTHLSKIPENEKTKSRTRCRISAFLASAQRMEL